MLQAFPCAIVKVDSSFPHGEKHGQWIQLAKDLSEVNDVLVGEIRIKEYGDRFNEDLALRYRYWYNEAFF